MKFVPAPSPLFFRLSLAANVVFLALGVTLLVRRVAASRGDRGARTYAAERGSILAALPPGEGGTVLLGDSLTDRGEWTELLGDPTARNRGVAGDTTRDVLARAPAIAARKPDRVFLQVGVNDLEAGAVPLAIAERYAAILDTFRVAAPRAHLFCQSVFPVREGAAPAPLTNAKIAELNRALAPTAEAHGCTWLDLTRALADERGALDARFTLDGLHLTGAGYAAWAGALTPHLGARAAPRP